MTLDAMMDKQTEDKILTIPERNIETLSITSNEKKVKDGIFEGEHCQKLPEFNPPDGGWGWIVCIVSFWTSATLFGIINTFGLLFVSLMDEFGKTGDQTIAFKTSWIGTLQVTMIFCCSPIASILTDRLGIQKTGFIGAVLSTVGMVLSSFVGKLEVMYVTYGVMVGVGASLLYTSSLVILGHYFKKRLGLVNGIVAFGCAIATILFPFIFGAASDTLGWRWTVRIQALFYTLLVFGSFVWKPLLAKPKRINAFIQNNGNKKCRGYQLCNLKIWSNKGYRAWAIALSIGFFGYFVPFIHLVKHSKTEFPQSNPEILLMCIGIATGLGRLISGKVADFPSVNPVRMHQFSFLTIGLATACLAFANAFWQLAVLAMIVGACDGCIICLLGPIAFDLLGTADAAQGVGCVLGLLSAPMTIGTPLAGLLYDQMGSYHVAFVLAGMPLIICAIILFGVPQKTQVDLSEAVVEIHPSNSSLAKMNSKAKQGGENQVATPLVMHSLCSDNQH